MILLQIRRCGMKRKAWWIALLGALIVGAVIYAVFGQIILKTPQSTITRSIDDVYALLLKLETKVDGMASQLNALSGALAGKLSTLTAQVAQIQSIVGSVSTTNPYGFPVSTGLAQFLFGVPGVEKPQYSNSTFLTEATKGTKPEVLEYSVLWALNQLFYQLWDGQRRQQSVH
jgi:uncharacterized membrane protein